MDINTDINTKDKTEEYLNNWKKERADLINYKKDELKRMEAFAKFAAENVILEVLELMDNLEIAVKNLPAEKGLGAVLKQFQDLIGKYGVERIKVEGEKFDPTLHEAVSSEDEGGKLEEVRAGYLMSDKVIRPARVKIIK